VTQKIDLSDVVSAAPTFYLAGESGNDSILGSMESDVLIGQTGKNTLRGLNGDDTLVSNGRDTMTGNRGSDTFVFTGLGKAVVTDFDANGGGKNQDYIYFQDSSVKPRIYQDHHNTVLDFGQGHSLTLTGVDRADFSLANDFKIPPAYEMI
jgi:Ca2+-binding RTX toxin-like protein